MDIIHLLPDSVANQIAAGEVVQRPASVVKELLENSLDAHATRLQLILREAGRELIQVIDDGQGMSATDARMAFEKHATSKITEAADLFNLHTMGFRGEALASIAAVAEVELRTRRPQDEAGVQLLMAGSQFVKQEACACAAGASFAVRNLFYNVPARRKFLKSNQTELSNVMQEVQRLALAHPQIEFTVVHNDVTTLQLTPGSLKQRIVQLFGKTIENQLLPVAMDNDLMHVTGFVSNVEGGRKKGALQYFFVNDRYMRHPYFHKAVAECYEGLVADNVQPNYFLFLQVDPESIDVNIHPTKTEIKFEDEPARWHILNAAVRESLGKFNAMSTIDFDQDDAPDFSALPAAQPLESTAVSETDSQPSYNPFQQTDNARWESLYEEFRHESPAAYADDDAPIAPSVTLRKPAVNAVIQEIPSRLQFEHDQPDNSEVSYQELPSAIGLRNEENDAPAPHADFLQIAQRYIITPAKNGLYLIDQHRAHYRLLYEQYLTQMAQRQGVSQQELFPEMIEIPPADDAFFTALLPRLAYLGFEIDSLGGGSYSVSGRPASLGKEVNLVELFHEFIEVAREEVHSVDDTLNRSLAHRLAQRQAIPYGSPLTADEMRHLVRSLFALPDHTTTAAGDKIVTLVSLSSLAALL